MTQYIYFGIPVLIGAIFWLIGYRLHLNFGRDVLEKTNKAESLKDAAEFARSFRSANFKTIADAIARLFGRRPPRELGQAVQHHRSALRSHAATEIDVLRDRRTSVAELIGDLPGAESSLIEQRRRGLAESV